jgi:mRNA-degrading endonuclease toxin of MazEF toxin-antitoxin module
MGTKPWPKTRHEKPKRWNGPTHSRRTCLTKRGEVWWVEFDPALDTEIKKTRPAVIVSNDAANRNLARVVVVPLTSNTGRAYPGEAVVTVEGQASKAMADQIWLLTKLG